MTFSYSTISVTTDYLNIVNLMPSATPPNSVSSVTQSSRFREIVGLPIVAPVTNFDLFFYDYLGIWYKNFNLNDIIPDIGLTVAGCRPRPSAIIEIHAHIVVAARTEIRVSAKDTIRNPEIIDFPGFPFQP